jgi:hypothetical protein
MSDGLLHVTRFIDRHGRERVYVRNPNAKRKKSIALTATTGTPEFMQQYHQALKTLGLSMTPMNAAKPRPAPQDMIDYHDLLGRYLLHVLRCGGDDFTGGEILMPPASASTPPRSPRWRGLRVGKAS